MWHLLSNVAWWIAAGQALNSFAASCVEGLDAQVSCAFFSSTTQQRYRFLLQLNQLLCSEAEPWTCAADPGGQKGSQACTDSLLLVESRH